MKALKGRNNVGGYASKFRLLCRRVVRRRERLFVTTSSHLEEFCPLSGLGNLLDAGRRSRGSLALGYFLSDFQPFPASQPQRGCGPSVSARASDLGHNAFGVVSISERASKVAPPERDNLGLDATIPLGLEADAPKMVVENQPLSGCMSAMKWRYLTLQILAAFRSSICRSL